MRREPCVKCGRAAPHSTLNRLKLCSHCAACKHPHATPGGSGPGGGTPVRDKTQENAGDGSGGSDRGGSGSSSGRSSAGGSGGSDICDGDGFAAPPPDSEGGLGGAEGWEEDPVYQQWLSDDGGDDDEDKDGEVDEEPPEDDDDSDGDGDGDGDSGNEYESGDESEADESERAGQFRWRDVANKQLYAGARWTVRQFAFLVLARKVRKQQSSAALKESLQLMAATVPVPNYVPPDLRAVRIILGVEHHSVYERHVCLGNSDGRGPTDACGLYPFCPRKLWNKSERCPACNETRFVEETDAVGRTTLRPRYPPAYYFGVRNLIRQWFADPVWCAERRATPRDEMSHTQWGGEYLHRVNVATGGQLWNPDNCVHEAGYDYVTPQKWNKKLEVGVFTLRSISLGTETRGQNTFVKVLMLIVTSEKPKWLAPYLSDMHAEYDELETTGIWVNDSFQGRQYWHRAWLLLAVGDAPMVTLFMNAWGHTATWLCYRCFFQAIHGSHLGLCGGMFSLGYANPQEQSKGHFKFSVSDGKLVQRRMAGTSIYVSQAQRTDHKLLIALAVHAESQRMHGMSKISTPCVKGRSVFAPREHFDLRFGVQIPIYHCFLFGVVKTFLQLVLPADKPDYSRPWVVCAEGRAEVKRRASCFVCPSDIGRPYRDVIKSLGGWTMEDVGFFVGTAGLFVLHDAWPRGSPFYQIFVYFNRAYHILFESTKPREEGGADTAVHCLLEAAKLCELHMPGTMCPPNLHTMVAHVAEGEVETGSSGVSNEEYVERKIRELVAATRNRATKDVGAFLVNELLARATVRMAPPELLACEDAVFPPPKPARRAATTRVDPAQADGDYFSTIGKRIYLLGAAGAELRALLNEWFAIHTDVDLAALGDDDVKIWEFGTCSRGGTEIHSRAYTRVKKRCSFHVAVEYEEHGVHFGEVLFFLLVAVPMPSGGERVFRLARIKLYHLSSPMTTTRPWAFVNPTVVYTGGTRGRVTVGNLLCDIETIKRKVVIGLLSPTRAMAMYMLKN